MRIKLFENFITTLKRDIDETDVSSEQELTELLKKYNIPLSQWGTSGFKTISHLFNEILENECKLSIVDGEIKREVNFVGARIIYKNKENKKTLRLWEEKAIFKDGRIRVREIEHSMAEKFKLGEDPKEALVRGMKEELNINVTKNQFIYYNKKKFENNEDYPGLRSYHTGYLFFIPLNKNQYIEEGYIEHQSDKDIYFTWKEMNKKI